MKTRISALMDGELEDHEVADTLRALRRDAALRADWADYHVVGAALRGERDLNVDVSSKVLAALELEPTVMAPSSRRSDWRRPTMALAASAAGVAVVAWLGLGATAPGSTSTTAEGLARTPAAVTLAQAPSSPRIQEYLVAHQAYAPGGAITGGARNNIRTVAMAGQVR